MVSVGMLGLGTVGQGVVELWRANYALISQYCPPMALTKVAVRQGQKARSGLGSIQCTTDAKGLVNDPNIQVIIEVIGGTNPALNLVTMALTAGKSVVTANKELIALHGPALEQIAQANGGQLLYEASVCGGLPVIGALRQGLRANCTRELMGIVNGTTNSILTAMTEYGQSFEQALKAAQEAGYAEADPTADVDGHDARFKLSILTGLAFHQRLHPDRIDCEGIRNITAADIDYADHLGCAIKLIAYVRQHSGQRLEAWVRPLMLPHTHPLAGVEGALNALLYEGNGAQGIKMEGPGAGANATASAIIGDVMAAAEAVNETRSQPASRFTPLPEAIIVPSSYVITSFALRMRVKNHPGVLAEVAACLAAAGLSIHRVLQAKTQAGRAEIFWVTYPYPEYQMTSALEQLMKLEVIEHLAPPIRVHASYHD